MKWNNSKKVFVHKDLESCNKVYVRVDRVKKPLEAPYEGPFLVISRKKKYFRIDRDGKKDTVSIDRIKPAYEFHDENTDQVKEVTTEKPSILKKRVSFYSELPKNC